MIKTGILFTCQICRKKYKDKSSRIRIYDAKQDKTTILYVCDKCFCLIINMIGGLGVAIGLRKTKKKLKKKKGWTEAKATRWALDHIS